jgi:hypothetical protein
MENHARTTVLELFEEDLHLNHRPHIPAACDVTTSPFILEPGIHNKENLKTMCFNVRLQLAEARGINLRERFGITTL